MMSIVGSRSNCTSEMIPKLRLAFCIVPLFTVSPAGTTKLLNVWLNDITGTTRVPICADIRLMVADVVPGLETDREGGVVSSAYLLNEKNVYFTIEIQPSRVLL